VTGCVARYRTAMHDFAGMTNLEVWYAHAGLDDLEARYRAMMNARQRKTVAKGTAKAMTRDSMQAFSKLTHTVDGKPRIIASPPLIVPIADLLPEQADIAGLEQQLGDLIAKCRRTLETARQGETEDTATSHPGFRCVRRSRA
jgi:Uncharacterized protein conserved in bacteria (DUF2252)